MPKVGAGKPLAPAKAAAKLEKQLRVDGAVEVDSAAPLDRGKRWSSRYELSKEKAQTSAVSAADAPDSGSVDMLTLRKRNDTHRRLLKLAQAITGDEDLQMSAAEDWGFDPATRTISYPVDAFEKLEPQQCLGLIYQQLAFCMYSRMPAAAKLDNPPFAYLWASMETLRINKAICSQYNGVAGLMGEVYAGDIDLMTRRMAAKLQPRVQQFARAFNYMWVTGKDKDPAVRDKKVKAAIEAAKPFVEAATRLPEGVDLASQTIDEAGIVAEATRSYEVVRDQLWPIFAELLEDDIADQKQQQGNLAGGPQSGLQGGGSGQPGGSGSNTGAGPSKTGPNDQPSGPQDGNEPVDAKGGEQSADATATDAGPKGQSDSSKSGGGGTQNPNAPNAGPKDGGSSGTTGRPKSAAPAGGKSRSSSNSSEGAGPKRSAKSDGSGGAKDGAGAKRNARPAGAEDGTETDASAGPKSGAKDGTKTDANDGAKSGANASPKDGTKTGAKSAANAGPKDGTKTDANDGAKSEANAGPKDGSKTDASAAAKIDSKSDTNDGSKPDASAASKPDARSDAAATPADAGPKHRGKTDSSTDPNIGGADNAAAGPKSPTGPKPTANTDSSARASDSGEPTPKASSPGEDPNAASQAGLQPKASPGAGSSSDPMAQSTSSQASPSATSAPEPAAPQSIVPKGLPTDPLDEATKDGFRDAVAALEALVAKAAENVGSNVDIDRVYAPTETPKAGAAAPSNGKQVHEDRALDAEQLIAAAEAKLDAGARGNLARQSNYQWMKSRVQKEIDYLVETLGNLFMRSAMPQWSEDHYKSGGKYDARRGHQARMRKRVTGKRDPKVYRRREEPTARKQAVILAVDISESMQDKIWEVKQAVVIFQESLAELGIDFGVVLFNKDINVIKDIRTPTEEVDREAVLPLLVPQYGTWDLGASKTAKQMLNNHDADQKLLLFLTDGAGTEGQDEIVKRLEYDHDIKSVGMGVGKEGCDAVKTTYEHHLMVEDVQQLVERFCDLLVEELLD